MFIKLDCVEIGACKRTEYALRCLIQFYRFIYLQRENDITKNHFIYKCRNKELIQKWHSGIPQLDLAKTPTYFNNEKKSNSKSTYDRMFHIQHGYCSSIHRDDREHTQGLDVNTEEKSKKVPMLSSTVYGHRPPLEVQSRMHVRVGLVKRDFYRHCGATIPTGD